MYVNVSNHNILMTIIVIHAQIIVTHVHLQYNAISVLIFRI